MSCNAETTGWVVVEVAGAGVSESGVGVAGGSRLTRWSVWKRPWGRRNLIQSHMCVDVEIFEKLSARWKEVSLPPEASL